MPTCRHRSFARAVLPCALLAALAAPVAPGRAADGAAPAASPAAAPAADDLAEGGRMAADYGCLNCHTGAGGAAPSLKHMGEEMGERSGDDGLKHALEEMREHDAVHTHRFVPDAPAMLILRWIAQRGK